jgi:hypothetical protein
VTPTPRSAPTIAFESLHNATTEVHSAPVVDLVATAPRPARRRAAWAAGGAAVLAVVVTLARFTSAPPVTTGLAAADSARTPAAASTSPAAPPAMAITPSLVPGGQRSRAASGSGVTRDGATRRVAVAEPARALSAAGRADSTRSAVDRRAKQQARDSIRRVESRVPVVVRGSIRAYAAAIESRDMGKLKAAYPLLSDKQESDWRKIFETSEAIHATVTVSAVSETPTSIEAPFSMALRIVRSDSHLAYTSRVPSVAKFRKDNGAWLLAEIADVKR